METLFSGVRFVLIGFDSISEAQYRSEIVNAGGVDVGRYDASCTHVIVHDRVYDDPVCVAARDDGKTLVTDLWVEASLDLGSLVDARRVLYQPVKDLKGITGADSLCVCLTGYQKPHRDDIMKMVDLMGAQFSKPLIAAKVTHLVCYKFEGEKYELAKRTKMKLINHRWLEDCLKFWDVLPVNRYNKSGWEIELMEAQASDSETETEMDISVIPKLQNGFTSGSSNPSKPLRELYNTDQDVSMADVPSCNADEHGNNWELHISGQQNKANEVDMMIESVGRNKLERYPGSGSKSSTSIAPDEVGRTDSRAEGLNGISNEVIFSERSGDADKEANKLSSDVSSDRMFSNSKKSDAESPPFSKRAEGLNGISNEVIFSERSGDADKEANKLSSDVSGDRMFSNSKKSDAESPPFSKRASDSLSNGHMVDNDKRNNTGKFMYLNSGHEGQIGGNNMIKEANFSTVKEVLTPIGKYGSMKYGSSINLKNNKRLSYFEVSNGSNGSPNISGKSMKVSPEGSSALLKRSSAGISGPRSIEGTNETSILPGSPSNENFGSFKPKALYASSGVQEDLLRKSTLTDDGKMHGLAMSPTSLKPVERTGEAPFRSVRSFESENPQMIIDVPHISCQQNSSSSIEKTSTALITDQNPDIPKVKCATLKKPLKRGRTVLLARSSSISKETEEDNNKKSPDLFLEEHFRVKSTICNESAGAMKTQSNAISDEVGKLPQPVAEGETSSPRNKCYEAPDFLDEGGVDGLVPSGAVRKKCYAKKSTNTRCKLFRSQLPKHEENISVTKEDGLEAGKELEESGIGKIVDIEKTEKPALTKVKGRKPKNNASALEEADKENRPSGSGNTILKTDQESLQKSVLSSSKLSSITKSSRLKIAKPEPSCFILSGHRLQRKEFQQIVRRLKGKVCRDTHQWSYEATHLIVPDPVRRTEKFFAATAAGRWVLKSDYLAASNQAGKFLQEDTYEWFKKGLNEDGAINMEAPRKWRLLRERTGHGALHGMRIIVYGECIAPPLDTLKRVVKAGDGVILATSPPYTRFLKSSVDYAIVSASISRSDYWIQEFLKHEIPCVVTDYLVEYVCKSGYPLERHVLYGTYSWAERSMQNLVSRSEEVVETSATPDKAEDDSKDGNDAIDVVCLVCGSRDREEVMLICGDETGALGCGAGSHIDCCNPPYDAVPEEDWFCPQCSIGNCSGSKSSKMSCKERRGKSSSKS